MEEESRRQICMCYRCEGGTGYTVRTVCQEMEEESRRQICMCCRCEGGTVYTVRTVCQEMEEEEVILGLSHTKIKNWYLRNT
jgi:hypothetical protein